MTNWKEFVEQLQHRMQSPLPGSRAHQPLRVTTPAGKYPAFNHSTPPKKGAVLIALHVQEGTLSFPLIKRAERDDIHAGQVSLPGGKAEPGEAAVATALREAHEEIGLPADQVAVVGQLTDFYVIPSNFMVTPVVGFVQTIPGLKAQASEVQRILSMPLNTLMDDQAIATSELLIRNVYKVIAPHFKCEGEIVWGATAMMLNELRWIVRDVMGEENN